MDSLKEELNEMIDYFDSCNISEEKQRDIVVNGVHFGFDGGWGVHHNLNCFQFAKYLKMCKTLEPDFDVEQLFTDLRNQNADKYRASIDYFLITYDKKNKKENTKTMK